MEILFEGYYETDEIEETEFGEKFRKRKSIKVEFPIVKRKVGEIKCNRIAHGVIRIIVDLPFWMSFDARISLNEKEVIEIGHGELEFRRLADMCLDDGTVYI